MTDIDYGELAALGFTKVTITYAGSGDQGFIEDVIIEPEIASSRTMERKLRELALPLLEEHYGGWENETGASGEIVIHVDAGKTFLNHGWRVESTQYENKLI